MSKSFHVTARLAIRTALQESLEGVEIYAYPLNIHTPGILITRVIRARWGGILCRRAFTVGRS